MTYWNAFLLGLVQAVTEFLPTSSFAHLILAQNVLGVGRNTGVLLEIMLHLGTAMAIVITFYKDFLRIISEIWRMGSDILGNTILFMHNRRYPNDYIPYRTVLRGTWRRLSAMVVISAFATALIGFACRRLVTIAALSTVVPGAGLLVSGVFLLVTDLGQVGERIMAREAGNDSAMWLGICQGISVFPGFSRSGLTICAGLLCGLGRKFIVKLTYIMSVPVCIGAFFMQIRQFQAPVMNSEMLKMYFFATAVSCLAGCILIRLLLKLSQVLKLRFFAFYNFAVGIAVLAFQFL